MQFCCTFLKGFLTKCKSFLVIAITRTLNKGRTKATPYCKPYLVVMYKCSTSLQRICQLSLLGHPPSSLRFTCAIDPVDVDVHAGPPEHLDDGVRVLLLDLVLEDDLVREADPTLPRVLASEHARATTHFRAISQNKVFTLVHNTHFSSCLPSDYSWLLLQPPVSPSPPLFSAFPTCLRVPRIHIFSPPPPPPPSSSSSSLLPPV